jgi:glutamate/tyrosine decarboxylase-like PLP-dependent enzyme
MVSYSADVSVVRRRHHRDLHVAKRYLPGLYRTYDNLHTRSHSDPLAQYASFLLHATKA